MYKQGRSAGTREIVIRPNYIVVTTEDAATVSFDVRLEMGNRALCCSAFKKK